MDTVAFKWSGKEFSVPVAPDDTVMDLKKRIADEINVEPKRQKVLGLKSAGGRLAGDDVRVCDVLKPGAKLMVMGTPESVHTQVSQEAEVAPQIQDDFDIAEAELSTVDVPDRPENQEKLQRRIANVEVKLLNPPRPGKKCLVVDIDYTIFDLGSAAERPEELARPYLHEFFSSVYEHYDIIIWSANSMNWIQVKMQQLGVSNHPHYKVVCFLDHRWMVTVFTEKYGVFNCKPLPVMWAKLPDNYNKDNTIMLDDLARNYIFNKQNGLVVKPYRKAVLNRSLDRELLGLKEYLRAIAPLESLSSLDHSSWKRYLKDRRIRW